MAGTQVADLAKLYIDNYATTITDSLTRSGIADANGFVDPNSLLGLLRDHGRVMIAGGANDEFVGFKEAARWKHQYASADTASSYEDGDPLLAAGNDSYENAYIDWRYNQEAVEVSGPAQDTGQGVSIATQRGIWATRFENATLDLFSNVEDQLLTDGSGNSNKDIDGVKSFLKQTGTYGNISITSNSWWRPYLKDASSAALSLTLMRDVKYEARARKSRIDFILTSQQQADAYRDLMGPRMRYTDIKIGDIEREVPTFDNVPIFEVQGFDTDLMVFGEWRNLAFRILPPSQDSLSKNNELGNYQGMPIRLKMTQPNRDADGVSLFFSANLICKVPYKMLYLDNLAV